VEVAHGRCNTRIHCGPLHTVCDYMARLRDDCLGQAKTLQGPHEAGNHCGGLAMSATIAASSQWYCTGPAQGLRPGCWAITRLATPQGPPATGRFGDAEVSKDDRTYARHYGRAPLNERAQEEHEFVRHRRFSMCAAMALDCGIVAARVVEGSFDQKTFDQFIHHDTVSHQLHY
jgi:hypothetical protein